MNEAKETTLAQEAELLSLSNEIGFESIELEPTDDTLPF